MSLIALTVLMMATQNATQNAAGDPCADTPCREAGVVGWELADGRSFEIDVPRSPYSIGPIGVVVVPGEQVRLRLSEGDGVLNVEVIDGGPRVSNPDVEARQAQFAEDMNAQTETMSDSEIDSTLFNNTVPGSAPRDETLGTDEVLIETYVREIGGELQTFFTLQSGLPQAVTFQMYVASPNSGEQFHWVSSCNLIPRLPSIEHFPYLTYNAAFVNFRMIEADGMTCGYWDLEANHPIDPNASGEN